MTLGVRQLCVAIAAALTAVAPTSRPAQDPLSRSLAAHGGLTAFQSIADWTIIAARPGDEIYEEHMRRDERSGGLQTLLIKRRSDGIQTFLHDGEAGFALLDGNLRNDPGAAAEAYYQAHGEYYLRALPFKWADPGMISSSAGQEKVRGRQAYRVELRADRGVGVAADDVWTAVIDTATHLLIEARLLHGQPQHERLAGAPERKEMTEIVYRFSDYRRAGPIQLPFRMEYWVGGERTGYNVIQHVTINGGIDARLFDPASHEQGKDHRPGNPER